MCFLKKITIPLLLTVFLIIPKPSFAGWLEFGAGCPAGSEPLTAHNITLDEFISFDVELSGLQSDTLRHDGTDYLRFKGTPGTAPLREVGYPELPVVTCFIAVPDESDLTLNCSAGCLSVIDCLPVYPAPLDSLVSDSLHTPWIKEFFRKDSSAYASAEWYPEVQAVLSGKFRLRDQRVAVVDVYPVQYLASEDSLRVWSDIELYINFEGADPVWTDAGLGYYDRLIGDRLIGYTPSYTYIDPGEGEVFRHENLSNPPPFTPDYIIIVADGLDGEWIDDFAEYRAELNGFDVLIANVDDILDQLGGSPPYPTPDLIRDYTERLWDWSNPGHRPTYLLLIGDHEDATCTTYPSWLLPTFLFEGHDPVYLSGNDEWYTCFGDLRDAIGLPDMIVGRLPAREADNLQDMLDLIVEYESEDDLPGSSYRRYITRLAGSDDDGFPFNGEDNWSPTIDWTDELRQWLGYDWDNYYCGDGENTETNPDGSAMTSADWVQACETVFERGSQVIFYTDHGGVHYFECAMNEDIPDYYGRPDSTFDDLDVRDLIHGEDQGHPFVLLYSCSQGTYNWTDDLQYFSDYSLWNCYSDDPFYDFGVDCFAEELMKNTDGGAIGVFAASWASQIIPLENIILQPFYHGITRTGDLIQAGRLSSLGSYIYLGNWKADIALYNLLGDPAVDIGDRVKFRDCCDLIVSPADIEMNRYPTLSLSGGSGEPELQVTVRNAGAVASGMFNASLEIIYDEQVWTSSARCNGLDPGEEETLQFVWHNPPSDVAGKIHLAVEADPQENTPDSWRGNNTAEAVVDVLDFYPNEDGWPVRTLGSVRSTPVLADLDGDGDLEIVITSGDYLIAAYQYDNPSSPMWITDPYWFSDYRTYSSITIPVIGNVCGDRLPEVIVDGIDSLFVFSGTSGELLCSFPHPMSNAWLGPQTVCLADLEPENPEEIPRDEMAVVIRDNLYIFRVQDGALEILDNEALNSTSQVVPFSWVSALDLNGTGPDELIISRTVKESGSPYYSGLYLYDYVTGEVYDVEVWTDNKFYGIPAAGSLPMSGDRIALSRRLSSSTYSPVFLLDPDDLSTPLECDPPTLTSDYVLCCVMADWELPIRQADRVIVNAENQAMGWDEDGFLVTGWDENVYPIPGYDRQPFPALGELDNQDEYEYADLLVGTKQGMVYAFANNADMLTDLGFPYTLPSLLFGGFVIADIDNDGYVEVVFGTKDNYLHIWELGRCARGYSPWPQCQHDAARTGVLLEE